MSKDGNGDPIPDSSRGIPLLEDGDGTNFFPTGNHTGKMHPPSGLTGREWSLVLRPRSNLLSTSEAHQDV
jgi:hypothetical protein